MTCVKIPSVPDTPRVSFVVPCYNLAHYLTECVGSILSQTYGDLEVLVMDDQSPDDTPAVVRAIGDPRVIHVRNETNLRHLRNYNKGIGLARGEFVWLISADDRLRSRDVLERYVRLLDAHPKVGYVFCPALAVVDGAESGVVPFTFNGPDDFVMNGREYFQQLLVRNRIAAPAVLARRRCYDAGLFPLDLPHSGDWYLWCLFAMSHDVAYFAEPMVNYRLHAANMTNAFTGARAIEGYRDEIRTVWRLHDTALARGDGEAAEWCRQAIARRYVDVICYRAIEHSEDGMTAEEFGRSVAEFVPDLERARRLRVAVLTHVADRCYAKRDAASARAFYRLAQVDDPGDLALRLKRWLLGLGPAGRWMRAASRSTET